MTNLSEDRGRSATGVQGTQAPRAELVGPRLVLTAWVRPDEGRVKSVSRAPSRSDGNILFA